MGLVENLLGNFASVAVGILTDTAFHYDREAAGSGECAPEESHKLGMGMFVVCNVAWAICFAVYLGMHCTYPKDRRLQLEARDIVLKEVGQSKEYVSEAT